MSVVGALALGVWVALGLGAHGVADTEQMKTAVHLAEGWAAVVTPGAFLASLLIETNHWKERQRR